MVFGTLCQLLEASQTLSGLILNALSFPLTCVGVDSSVISTEVKAWHMMEGDLFRPAEEQFPVGDIRWSLAATRGARHWIHIDSDGFGTYVETKMGDKWWIIFSPPEKGDKRCFASVYQFLNNFHTNAEQDSPWYKEMNKANTDSDEVDEGNANESDSEEGLWITEAILLTPGTHL